MKNKYTIHSYVLLASQILLLLSCQHKEKIASPKEDNNQYDILSIMERYFKVANAEVDGTFIIQSNVVDNDREAENSALI